MIGSATATSVSGPVGSAYHRLMSGTGSTDGSSDDSNLRRLAPELIGSPGRFALVCATGVVSATIEAVLLAAVVEVAVTLAADETRTIGVPGTAWDLGLGQVVAIAIGLTVLKIVASVLGARMTAALSTDTLVRLRTELYGAFTHASWSRQSVERTGTLQELLSSHTWRAATATLLAATATFSAVNFVVLAIVALLVHPLAAALILAAVVLLYFLLRPITRFAYKSAHRRGEAAVDYANMTVELTDMAEEVTTFDVGSRAERLVASEIQMVALPHRRAELMSRLLPELYTSTSVLVIFIGLAVVAAINTDQVSSLGVVVILLVRALTRAQAAQSAWHRVTEFLPDTQRVVDHRDDLRASATERGGAEVGPIGQVALEGIGFSYSGGEEILKDVSFTIDRGEAIGVVGPSGSGKTTLLEIVLRLRTDYEGTYRVNGADAASLDLAEHTRRMAFVPQKPRLLTATAAENIRFLRPDITDEAVRQAARTAHIAEEIEAFEDGWDTVISERGRGLSGGQRQRLCLARALAGSPDLLVLDEPTSALDSRSEALLRESLAALAGQVTVVLVAHRGSTLSICRRAVVLVEGRVVAIGPPNEVAGGDGVWPVTDDT